jgi:hypothetical protein
MMSGGDACCRVGDVAGEGGTEAWLGTALCTCCRCCCCCCCHCLCSSSARSMYTARYRTILESCALLLSMFAAKEPSAACMNACS